MCSKKMRDAGDVRPFVGRTDVENDGEERDRGFVALHHQEFHPVFQLELVYLLFQRLGERGLPEAGQRERNGQREEKKPFAFSEHSSSFG